MVMKRLEINIGTYELKKIIDILDSFDSKHFRHGLREHVDDLLVLLNTQTRKFSEQLCDTCPPRRRCGHGFARELQGVVDGRHRRSR